MAATRLIPLHQNKGKTLAQSLRDRVNYAQNPSKTEQGELVTGYACDPITVEEEFLLSKREYVQRTGKAEKNDVIAYQIRQSFRPGEVSPEEANAIGQELAMRFTKGRYAFIVATHTDKEHIHNHIIFNSTALDGSRKFRNFFLSSFAIQRISDNLCLQHGLSVIEPKPYREREKRTIYPQKESHRDRLCAAIDAVLERKPKDLEDFIHQMENEGFTVKRGKNLAFQGKDQKRFIRLRSLGDGYSEDEIRAALRGKRQHTPRKPRKQQHTKKEQGFGLLIDIQNKMSERGPGYQRWATVHNLKQMSKTLLFLRDNGIDSVEALEAKADEAARKFRELSDGIKASEKRLAEIAVMKKHVVNFVKTRETYTAYRKEGCSREFLEEHREEITLHRAAKQAFNEAGISKLPKVKGLNVEYAQVLEDKKKAYAEYHKSKEEMQEFLRARKNIEDFLENSTKIEKGKAKRENEI